MAQGPALLSHGSGRRLDGGCFLLDQVSRLGAYQSQDWHIDFAGSSVYYHILWGRKVISFALLSFHTHLTRL